MKAVLILIIPIIMISCVRVNKDITDVETIWENYLNKFGDREQIANLKTVSIVSESSLFDGKATGKMEYFIKDGKIKLHYSSKDMDAVTIYNGKDFTRYINGEKKDVQKSEENGIIRLCDFYHEVNYKKHGFNIELVDTVKINSIETYKVKYYSKDMISYYFINKNDYSLVNVSEGIQEFWPIEIASKDGFNYFSKYKTTDEYGTNVTEIVSIEFNGKIEDSIFNEKISVHR